MKWISVDERLPENTDDVLLWIKTRDQGYMSVGYFVGGSWFPYRDHCEVTYWMSVEPPKEN